MKKFEVINPEYLVSISQNNIELIEKIYIAYTQQTELIVKQIQQSVDIKDFNKIGKLFHTLKSTFSILGITQCQADILYAENKGEIEIDLHKIIEILKKIEGICLLANKEMIIFIENIKKQ